MTMIKRTIESFFYLRKYQEYINLFFHLGVELVKISPKYNHNLSNPFNLYLIKTIQMF